MITCLRHENNKKIKVNIIKYVRKLFRLKKENEAIKDRVIKNIRNLLDHKEEDYYKPVRLGISRSNNYIEYESNSDIKRITN